MASRGTKKQITFDLAQDMLRAHYPNPQKKDNPQFFKKAYSDIQRFMLKHNYEHRQYSVYVSKDNLTTVDMVSLMQELAEKMPWLFKCVNEIDVTNIGPQFSLLQSLGDATIGLDSELDSASFDQGQKDRNSDISLAPEERSGHENHSVLERLESAKKQLESKPKYRPKKPPER